MYFNPIPDMGRFPGREGIWGFAGTSAEAQTLRSDSKIFYVDAGHANANDDNDGLDPQYPLATIQSLIDRTYNYLAGTSTVSPVLETYDTIYVSGTVEEDVNTYNYDEMPSYINIIGAGSGRYAPAWIGDDASTTSLDLRAIGWRVEGFRFYGKTGASCVELHHTDLGGNDIAIRTVIQNCYFDGLVVGLRGIESHGCYDCWFINNTFALWNNAGNTAVGMEVTTTPLAIPYRNYFIGNMFHDSDNGAIFSCNGSFWTGNMFQPVGYAYSMIQVLNTSTVANPGDDNVVWGNTFPGDYSLVGGYRGGAADVWIGNWADDIAEAEVSACGITILPPA